LDNQQTPERPGDVIPPSGAATAPSPRDARANGILFVLVTAAIILGLYQWLGPDGVIQVFKAALGLGLVIFLHELGHFAVAKWCDVHVETFSIGFGPALPGCSFRRGETTYKIAMIPLGGYVKMVGEGADNDESDEDPRSFKNKTVGQRMAIISAGVVMNVIFGCVCFILAYQGGLKQPPGVIGAIEAGSPAWKTGMRSGDDVLRIGDAQAKDAEGNAVRSGEVFAGASDMCSQVSFEDLLYEVMLSRAGQDLPVILGRVNGDKIEAMPEFTITPRKNASDAKPVIGLTGPQELRLLTKRLVGRTKEPPVVGPAAAARELALEPGDLVTATTDPSQTDQMKPLPPKTGADGPTTDFDALCVRFVDLAGKPMTVEIRRHGRAGTEKLQLAETGFRYGDRIVGTSDADLTRNHPYNPYRVEALPDDPRNPEPGHPDFFVFTERMERLAGKPVVLQIRRQDAPADDAPVPVLVPVSYHRTIQGMRMKMGKVKGVRDDSPAAKAGVQPGDRLIQVELTDGTKTVRCTSEPGKEVPAGVEEYALDPLRLMHQLRRWLEQEADSKVRAQGKIMAKLSVARDYPVTTHNFERTDLPPVAWDESWRFNQELPLNLTSPLSIPELGVAYQVETRVDFVEPGSAADKAGLRKDDVVLSVLFKEASKKNGDWPKEQEAVELYSKDKKPWWALWRSQTGEIKPEPWWGSVFWVYQVSDIKEMRLKVQRGSEETDIEVTPLPEKDWPIAQRGLRLMPEVRLQKADSPLEALVLGLKRTKMMIVNTYRGIISMVTDRVSATKNLRGPIRIAHIAFDIAGDDFPQFMFFLAVISVNLAVINFLPIPVLDGGHMVFLIYEKLRGRPASEQVRLGLTYLGLLLILSLMVFVIYLDVKSYLFG
jgi:membrane-associated protease RseP (regulator of RpoE activity)